MKLYLLSGEHIGLAREEIFSLVRPSSFIFDEKVLCINTKKKIGKRLAYTHKIFKLLFRCKKTKLFDTIRTFDFQTFYTENYKVTKIDFCKSIITEKILAEKIWYQLKKPNINLKKPKTEFNFIFTKNNVYCCLIEEDIDKSIINRKPHLRPKTMPISLNPKLARCMVNLTGIHKETIVDPYCGTGGILIEAGLMGFSVLGFDNDIRMIDISKNNLKHYKIKDFELKESDTFAINRKIPYIVTDLPYGKNTKSQDMKIFEKKFIDFLNQNLTKRAIIGWDRELKNNILLKYNLKITKKFEYYIHKSMTKKIMIIEKV